MSATFADDLADLFRGNAAVGPYRPGPGRAEAFRHRFADDDHAGRLRAVGRGEDRPRTGDREPARCRLLTVRDVGLLPDRQRRRPRPGSAVAVPVRGRLLAPPTASTPGSARRRSITREKGGGPRPSSTSCGELDGHGGHAAPGSKPGSTFPEEPEAADQESAPISRTGRARPRRRASEAFRRRRRSAAAEPLLERIRVRPRRVPGGGEPRETPVGPRRQREGEDRGVRRSAVPGMKSPKSFVIPVIEARQQDSSSPEERAAGPRRRAAAGAVPARAEALRTAISRRATVRQHQVGDVAQAISRTKATAASRTMTAADVADRVFRAATIAPNRRRPRDIASPGSRR